jgi:hypothetical protein
VSVEEMLLRMDQHRDSVMNASTASAGAGASARDAMPARMEAMQRQITKMEEKLRLRGEEGRQQKSISGAEVVV